METMPTPPSHNTEQPTTSGGRGLRQRRWRQVLIALGVAFLAFCVWFVPPVYLLVSGPVTVTRWEKKKGKTQAVVGPGQSEWIPSNKISKHMLNAIVVAEDGRFYQHHGLDLEAIRAAYLFNKRRGHYARGGSTITQQVVKMAFLDREKTLTRKAREAIGTLLLELILPKERILEWHVNLAEFGDGVYGIKNGAWHYFKTKPEQISTEQAVHLALVLPSPNAWSRGLRKHELSRFGHKRYATILLGMRQSGYITQAQWITGITRGNFGRPINGYEALLTAEAGGLCKEDGDAEAMRRAGCPDDAKEDPKDSEDLELKDEDIKKTEPAGDVSGDVYSGPEAAPPVTPTAEPNVAEPPKSDVAEPTKSNLATPPKPEMAAPPSNSEDSSKTHESHTSTEF